MQFDTLAELWSMSGHGPYVWSAYAIVFTVILALVRAPLARRRRLLDRVRRRATASGPRPPTET